ncbi:hypothetical protein MMC25_000614 [Agyrium rufum]|nr:hypothetical protein [Agyrium rufum]
MVGRRSKHTRANPPHYESMLKKSISDPFNFTHLTHTCQNDAKSLQDMPASDLVSEFSAIRASQAPRRELKGIKAESIDGIRPLSRQSSFPTASSHSPYAPLVSSFTVPMTDRSTNFSRDHVRRDSTRSNHLRNSPSMDNLARISPMSFSSPTPPQSPPPRRSSRFALTMPNDCGLTFAPTSTMATSSTRSSSLSNSSTQVPVLSVEAFSSVLPDPESSAVGSAVSTPDDSAFTLRPQLSSANITLADVPEEEEQQHVHHRRTTNGSESRADNSQSGLQTSPESASTSDNEDGLQMTQRNPVSQQGLREPITAWAFEADNVKSFRDRASKRMSRGLQPMMDSWEEDIDYCYEHEAEADSAFDWDRTSIDESRVSGESFVLAGRSAASSFVDYHGRNNICAPVLPDGHSETTQVPAHDHDNYSCDTLTSHLNIPDSLASLETRSPMSASSSFAYASEAQTPSEDGGPNLFRSTRRFDRESGIFPLSPSMYLPAEYQTPLSEEDSNFTATPGSESHKDLAFPMYEPQSLAPIRSLFRQDSLNSVESPLSKSYSCDSIFVARRASKESQAHRSTSSAGSLPELIHSKRSKQNLKEGIPNTVIEMPFIPVLHVTNALTAEASPSVAVVAFTEQVQVTAKDATMDFSVHDSIPEEREELDASVVDEECALSAASTLAAVRTLEPARLDKSLRRERSQSDSARSVTDLANGALPKEDPEVTTASCSTPMTVRARSQSVATGMTKKCGRASYSLFPTVR